MLFRMAVVKGSVGVRVDRGEMKMMFIDVKKAHLNGKLKIDEFSSCTCSYKKRPAEEWEDCGGGCTV